MITKTTKYGVFHAFWPSVQPTKIDMANKCIYYMKPMPKKVFSLKEIITISIVSNLNKSLKNGGPCSIPVSMQHPAFFVHAASRMTNRAISVCVSGIFLPARHSLYQNMDPHQMQKAKSHN